MISQISEDQLQAQIWRRAWNEYPEARRCMWAVPNAAVGKIITLSDQVRANTLKATGLLEGVWDMHLFWHGTFYIFENKVGNNQLTVDYLEKKKNGDIKKHYGQKEWGEIMEQHGAIKHVIRTVDEFFITFHKIIRGANL